MTVQKTTDAALAQRIRDATDALHAAIDAAHDAGIQVSFGVSTWIGNPSKSYLSNLRIERPANWRQDYPGCEL